MLSDGRWAAYLLVAAVLIVLAADIYRMGFVYIDNFRILEHAHRTSWPELVSDTADLGEIYRPLNVILTKALFEIRGADFFVYRTAHLVTLAVLLLGWLKACDPRTAAGRPLEDGKKARRPDSDPACTIPAGPLV